MSMILGHLGAKEALIATDTICVDMTGSRPPSETSKCFAFPHLKTVVAVQGSTIFYSMMLMAVSQLCPPGGSFDGIKPHLGDIVSNAYEVAADGLTAAGVDHVSRAVFAGWSESAGAPVGVCLTNAPLLETDDLKDGDDIGYSPEFSRIDIEPGYFGIPYPPMDLWKKHLGDPKGKGPFDAVVASCKATREFFDRRNGPGKFGGRIVVTRITQWTIEQKIAYAWPDAGQLSDWATQDKESAA